MIARLTVAQVAASVNRHPKTVRNALEAGELHGHQARPQAHWRVREDCAEAWADGLRCEHQQAAANKNVTHMRARSA